MAEIVFVPSAVSGGGGGPTGPAGGDLFGLYPNPGVDGLQGVSISAAAPVAGDVLSLVAGVWTPTPMAGGGTLQSSYTGGGTISTTLAKTIAFDNAVDNVDLLRLTRTFPGNGDALEVLMAAGTTGRGIRVVRSGTGTGVLVTDGIQDQTGINPGLIFQSQGNNLDIAVIGTGAGNGSINLTAGAGGGGFAGSINIEAGIGTPSGTINIGEVGASAVNIGGALGLSQNMILSARSSSILLNGPTVANNALSGFTATSIVGALNELNAATGNSLQNAYDLGPDIVQDATGGMRFSRGTAPNGDPLLELSHIVAAPSDDVLSIVHTPTSAATGGNALSIQINNFSPVGTAIRIENVDLSEATNIGYAGIFPEAVATWSIIPVNVPPATTGVNLTIVAGTGGTTGAGGSVGIAGGLGGSSNGNGGPVTISGGNGSAVNSDGGSITINAGALAGTGADGVINIGSLFASAINIGGALAVGEDFTLGGHGATIALNGPGAGDISLAGFTATSIVGALNELKAAPSASSSVTTPVVIENGVTIAVGDVVAASTVAGRCTQMNANANTAGNFLGIASVGGTGDAGGTVSATVSLAGLVTDGGAAFTQGALYAPDGTGRPTNTAPANAGDLVLRVGWAFSATQYIIHAGEEIIL